MKPLSSMLFAAVLFVAGGCKKNEESAKSAPAAPAEPGAAAAPNTGGKQACDLISTEKLSELSGIKWETGKTYATGDTSSCGWSPEDPTLTSGGGLSIMFYRGNTGKEAWKNMTAAGLGGEPVAGVGDEMVRSTNMKALRVRKGDHVAMMDWYVELTPEQQKAIATELASNM